MTCKKIVVWILLIILIVSPFINWRVGAVIWLCAWIMYVLQMAISALQSRKPPSEKD